MENDIQFSKTGYLTGLRSSEKADTSSLQAYLETRGYSKHENTAEIDRAIHSGNITGFESVILVHRTTIGISAYRVYPLVGEDYDNVQELLPILQDIEDRFYMVKVAKSEAPVEP